MNNLLSARGGQRGNGVADSLDEAKAAFRRAWSEQTADEWAESSPLPRG
jgi:hypothetical protein